MNRRRFLKYAGATATFVGASALGLDYLLTRGINPSQTTTTSVITVPAPTIENLKWTPTRVQNGKVYDGNISFDVENPNFPPSEVELTFTPVFPSEIPKAAIPAESTRSYSFTGTHQTENFSQSVTDLKGGKQYSAEATAKDQAGKETAGRLDVPYVREFENIIQNLKIRATALYYPAYTAGARDWNGTIGTPLLGHYDSSDPFAINRHIDWASGFGIGTFLPNFTGPTFPSTSIVKDVYMKNPIAEDMKFAFQYESHWRLRQTPAPGWFNINVDDSSNREVIKNDFDFLAQNFFDDSNYLRIDSKPVVYLYLARALIGDVPSFINELRRHMENIGHEIYLVADEVFWYYNCCKLVDPTTSSVTKRIKSYDAITAFNTYSPGDEELLNGFESNVDSLFSRWSRVAKSLNVGFIPCALPGIDLSVAPWNPPELRSKWKPLQRSVERFREQLNICKKYVDPKLQTLLIFFNEWNENSGVEPSVEDGFKYLQTLRDTLAGH